MSAEEINSDNLWVPPAADVHPGGLVLHDVPMMKRPEKVFYKLAEGLYPAIIGELQVLADDIVDNLSIQPRTIRDFCNKNDAYNKLSYAAEQLKYDDLKFDCVVCQRFCGRIGYITVTPKFRDNVDPILGMTLNFRPSNSKKSHMTKIHAIRDLCLEFELGSLVSEMINTSALKCVVSVLPSLMNFCSWHRTIQKLQDVESAAQSVVFPKASQDEIMWDSCPITMNTRLNDFNFVLDYLNDLQKRTVLGIVANYTANVPYIVYGPPGTGKTLTLAEAVVHLVRQNDEHRVLVCTPSNMAADRFALMLVHIGGLDKSVIFRVFSSGHQPEDQDPELEQLTHVVPENGRSVFGIPEAKDMLKRYRVFIMTLSCSTYFVSARLKGRFSHIIIDEAGQAKEIDTLVPIGGLGNAQTRCVLAGDPMQLGPVEMCRFAKELRLNTSLLERIMYTDPYASSISPYMCMLRENYRSHPALVALPSKMMYDDLLIASTPISERNSLCQWEHLPRKGFPLFFHTVIGKEEKDASGGYSLCNLAECAIVIDYVQALIGYGIAAKDIGIISPYKYQVAHLRDGLKYFTDLTVDTVEKYQGSERRVIIVSTVRTQGLGFLSDEKRLNTTITRAKELLIVVGNHKNLNANRKWRMLVDYCRFNKALIEDFVQPAEMFKHKPQPTAKNRINGKLAEFRGRLIPVTWTSIENSSITDSSDLEEEESLNLLNLRIAGSVPASPATVRPRRPRTTYSRVRLRTEAINNFQVENISE